MPKCGFQKTQNQDQNHLQKINVFSFKHIEIKNLKFREEIWPEVADLNSHQHLKTLRRGKINQEKSVKRVWKPGEFIHSLVNSARSHSFYLFTCLQ